MTILCSVSPLRRFRPGRRTIRRGFSTGTDVRSGGGPRERFYLGLLIDGDFGKFSVIAFQAHRLLMAIRGFPPHLDTANRAAALVHDHALNLREPAAMADTHMLSDS
jgi:hypothetical protein